MDEPLVQYAQPNYDAPLPFWFNPICWSMDCDDDDQLERWRGCDRAYGNAPLDRAGTQETATASDL